MASLLPLVVIWFGLEFTAACHFVSWRGLFDRISGVGEVNQPYKTGFLFDSELEFRRPPNACWTGKAAGDIEAEWSMRPVNPPTLTFAYDPHGYRNRASMDHAAVAMLGDSFVEGWYVNAHETTASILESELSRPVANLGIAGYGTQQQLVVLKRESQRLRPSLIIWCFFEGNDLYEDFRFQRTLNSLASNQAKNFFPGQPILPIETWDQRSWTMNCLRLLRIWIHPLAPQLPPYWGELIIPEHGRLPIYFAPYASVAWSDWHAQRWTLTQSYFQEGARYCREQGMQLLICYIPIKFRVCLPFVGFPSGSPCPQWSLWTLPKDFAAFCTKNQMPFVDFTVPLQEAVKAGGMPYASQDSHWGAEGHKLVAHLLYSEIHRRGWLVSQP